MMPAAPREEPAQAPPSVVVGVASPDLVALPASPPGAPEATAEAAPNERAEMVPRPVRFVALGRILAGRAGTFNVGDEITESIAFDGLVEGRHYTRTEG